MSIQNSTMLVSLSIVMPPQTKLAKRASDEVEGRYRTARRQARVNKDLFSKQDIRPLQQAASRARKVFNEISLPYDDSNRIITTRSFMKFTEKMRLVSSDFSMEKHKFMNNHQQNLGRAREKLGTELFNYDDYPTALELNDKISFTVESSVLPKVTAFDELIGLDAEAVEELKEQAVSGQQQKVEAALKDLFNRLFDSLGKAAERLEDEDAIFKNTLVSNIKDAVVAIETLNLTDNQELIALAEEVKKTLEGIEPDDLRKDKVLRQETSEKTQELVDRVGEFL